MSNVFFESVRVLVMRFMNQGEGKKISLPEMNARIRLEQYASTSYSIDERPLMVAEESKPYGKNDRKYNIKVEKEKGVSISNKGERK